VHYDDLLRVPLTSIDQDSNGLGASAAKLALGIIKRKGISTPKTVLWIRNSWCVLPASGKFSTLI
jgi:DNA-binding LacI/PurR family transcriptional regulator